MVDQEVVLQLLLMVRLENLHLLDLEFQKRKTFTFSGGSSTEVTKDYVDTQDASTLQSAKDYADGLVSSTGVSSLNGLTGAIRITPGSSNVSIASSEGQVSISVSGGGDGDPGQDGDTYRTFNIYQNTDSNEVIPSISSGAVPPTWDTVNNKLLNCPTGWATDQTYERVNIHEWLLEHSLKVWGSMIEGWIGPICITGEKGVPGADGSSLEFIYTLTANETSIPAYPSSLSDLKHFLMLQKAEILQNIMQNIKDKMVWSSSVYWFR